MNMTMNRSARKPADDDARRRVIAPTPLFIRPARVSELFGIHRGTLYRWAAAGHVTIHKRGAASFVSVSELSDFITGIERGDTPAAKGGAA